MAYKGISLPLVHWLPGNPAKILILERQGMALNLPRVSLLILRSIGKRVSPVALSNIGVVCY